MGWPRTPWKFGPYEDLKIFYFDWGRYIYARLDLNLNHFRKIVGQIRWHFRFWMGSVVTLGPRKAWVPSPTYLWSHFSRPVWIFAARCSKQCSNIDRYLPSWMYEPARYQISEIPTQQHILIWHLNRCPVQHESRYVTGESRWLARSPSRVVTYRGRIQGHSGLGRLAAGQ